MSSFRLKVSTVQGSEKGRISCIDLMFVKVQKKKQNLPWESRQRMVGESGVGAVSAQTPDTRLARGFLFGSLVVKGVAESVQCTFQSVMHWNGQGLPLWVRVCQPLLVRRTVKTQFTHGQVVRGSAEGYSCPTVRCLTTTDDKLAVPSTLHSLHQRPLCREVDEQSPLKVEVFSLQLKLHFLKFHF